MKPSPNQLVAGAIGSMISLALAYRLFINDQFLHEYLRDEIFQVTDQTTTAQKVVALLLCLVISYLVVLVLTNDREHD